MLLANNAYSTNETEDGIKAISEALEFLPKLTHLILSSCGIPAQGAILIFQNLHHLPLLSELILDNNQLGAEGIIALSNAL